MKHLIFSALLVSGLAGASAQNASAQVDTTITTVTTTTTTSTGKKDKKFTLTIGSDHMGGPMRDSIRKADASKGRFVGGITFTRMDLGYSRLIDNGSFTLSPENEFLDYRGGKTSTFSFDIAQMGYRFNQNFKIYVAGGFDWTHIRLNRDITIQRNQKTLTYVEDDINFSKNRFSSSYVHIPLNFELRTKENDKGNRFYFIAGPELSFLLNGKVKQVSEERGKEKFKDDYNFQAIRYGATARFGYDGIGFFTKFYFNDMF
ncbi:MAG: PorT family protein, partial [Pedobacter sp.]